MHVLNEQTCQTLSRKLGKTYNEMLQMSAEELDALVEARIGKKLTPAFSLKNMVNRGSVYLFFKRFTSRNEIDKRLARFFSLRPDNFRANECRTKLAWVMPSAAENHAIISDWQYVNIFDKRVQ